MLFSKAFCHVNQDVLAARYKEFSSFIPKDLLDEWYLSEPTFIERNLGWYSKHFCVQMFLVNKQNPEKVVTLLSKKTPFIECEAFNDVVVHIVPVAPLVENINYAGSVTEQSINNTKVHKACAEIPLKVVDVYSTQTFGDKLTDIATAYSEAFDKFSTRYAKKVAVMKDVYAEWAELTKRFNDSKPTNSLTIPVTKTAYMMAEYNNGDVRVTLKATPATNLKVIKHLLSSVKKFKMLPETAQHIDGITQLATCSPESFHLEGI